ncbi:MAG: BCD family MFS transporter [Pseudomonadota bacterium]|nr:BCD family MFS transporter [Pseudomonadota bacterium]
MNEQRPQFADAWKGLSRKLLPFADVASEDLPLTQLLRLSLFQVSVGMMLTLLAGTLNRVMIVELFVPTWLVALMISLPLVFAPLRALIGHKSDAHVSVLGWRRGPFIWFGSLFMFGGLAIMPFALILLSGAGQAPAWIGQAGAALAFLLVGAGLHTTQTAGLALASDIAPVDVRPRVVALLYVMLLVGMGVSALIYGALLTDFSHDKLVRVIQGSAVVVIVLNVIALWRQEVRNPEVITGTAQPANFKDSWKTLMSDVRSRRLLMAVGVGSMAFSMQDILLEPYGAELLGMSVSETTRLTALFAFGTILGFAMAAKGLSSGLETHRLGAIGVLIGVVAFTLVIFAEPIGIPVVFQAGTFLIGLGGGLFSVCMLTSAMELAESSDSGIALGAWGAVQATAAGLALAIGGAVKDGVEALVGTGVFGQALNQTAIGYSVVYHIEILLLFVTLAVLGPIAAHARQEGANKDSKFGLAAFPD